MCKICLGVPVEYKGWGSNFWFDLLCKLAYPHIKVAGSYSFAGDPDDAKKLAIIQKQRGEAYTLRDGRKILLAHGHAFGVVGGDVSLAKTYMNTAVDSGTIDQVVVVQWTDNGPMKIVTDPAKIDMAVTPANDYDPGKRLLSNPNPVAQRQFVIQ